MATVTAPPGVPVERGVGRPQVDGTGTARRGRDRLRRGGCRGTAQARHGIHRDGPSAARCPGMGAGLGVCAARGCRPTFLTRGVGGDQRTQPMRQGASMGRPRTSTAFRAAGRLTAATRRRSTLANRRQRQPGARMSPTVNARPHAANTSAGSPPSRPGSKGAIRPVLSSSAVRAGRSLSELGIVPVPSRRMVNNSQQTSAPPPRTP